MNNGRIIPGFLEESNINVSGGGFRADLPATSLLSMAVNGRGAICGSHGDQHVDGGHLYVGQSLGLKDCDTGWGR